MDLHRGLIRAYDATTHTAAILLAGSLSRTLLSVPVAHHIGPELLTEGAACAVAFFEDQAHALLVATFDGPPDPWITADMLIAPATPEGSTVTETDSQALTTTATTYGDLSIAVTVPAGKTYRVFVIAHVEFNCSSYTNYNNDTLRIYEDATAVGYIQGIRTNAANDRAAVSNSVLRTITADATYTAKISKAIDRNTEEALRGAITVIYWQDT